MEKRIGNLAIEALTLGTARGRLIAWSVLTGAIFASKYVWLEHLSLWQRLGWDWAPSIGLTRSYWLVIHGDISSAWSLNPLIFVVIGVGSILLCRDAHSLFK